MGANSKKQGTTLDRLLGARRAPERTLGPERVRVTPPSAGPEGAREFVEMVREDVTAVLQNDPAARHALEVVLVYPGLHAIWMHRISHGLWRRGHVLAPRLMAHAARWVTGVEIHPGARIGRRVFIDHGMGVVIGETAIVGDGCLIYKGAVLGGTSPERTDRHPRLGRDVTVGTNATVLGSIQIGDGAKIGSNSVVIRDVPENSTVVGVPGRVAEKRKSRALDHADLPDVVMGVLKELADEIDALRAQVAALESRPSARAMARDNGAAAHDVRKR